MLWRLEGSGWRSVQFSHSVVSDSLRPHGLQHAKRPCPSPTPGVHLNPQPLSQWCHPATSSSVVPFSSCPQSLPASETFPMRWPKYWSFSFSIIPIYIYLRSYFWGWNWSQNELSFGQHRKPWIGFCGWWAMMYTSLWILLFHFYSLERWWWARQASSLYFWNWDCLLLRLPRWCQW